MTFTANPEDYTARGKIITPLKDRIGSEIRTHYPQSRGEGMAITAQEAWLDRATAAGNGAPAARIPAYVSEIVEEVAFQARQDRRVDKRSGVSQRLPISVMENVLSNAERRAVATGEPFAVPRVTDLYTALPSMTGKFELEYEGELKGAENIARELVRGAVATVAEGYLTHLDPRRVIEWFDLGGSLQLGDTVSATELVARAGDVQGLVALAHEAGVPKNTSVAELASGIDFVLEGLYATRRISRSDERGYHAAEPPVRRPTRETAPRDEEPTPPSGGNKKKYYN
jgi:magnesium chelatase subunit I